MSIKEAHEQYLYQYAKVTIKIWARNIWNDPNIFRNHAGYKLGVIKHSYGYDVTMRFITYMKKNCKPRGSR